MAPQGRVHGARNRHLGHSTPEGSRLVVHIARALPHGHRSTRSPGNVFAIATMQKMSIGRRPCPPQRKRTLGQRLIREFVMWIAAAIVAVIAMTIMYQVIMTVVVPELIGGLSSSPAAEETVSAYT